MTSSSPPPSKFEDKADRSSKRGIIELGLVHTAQQKLIDVVLDEEYWVDNEEIGEVVETAGVRQVCCRCSNAPARATNGNVCREKIICTILSSPRRDHCAFSTASEVSRNTDWPQGLATFLLSNALGFE